MLNRVDEKDQPTDELRAIKHSLEYLADSAAKAGMPFTAHLIVVAAMAASENISAVERATRTVPLRAVKSKG